MTDGTATHALEEAHAKLTLLQVGVQSSDPTSETSNDLLQLPHR